MRLTILGSGSPLPDPDRAGPSTLVSASGGQVLVDCGRGVLMRLAGAGSAARFLSAVLLTHLHSDHICDLNDVITTYWVTSFDEDPLLVVGPVGTRSLVERTLAMLEDDIRYRMAHHEDLRHPPRVEVREVEDGNVDLGVEGLGVVAAPTEHSPVKPTVGYRFEQGDASVVVAGDTVPCEGLDRLVAGASVYAQTTIRADLVRAIGVPRLLDILRYHSTVEQAADAAARGGVRKLVITHQIPAPPLGSPVEEEWHAMASARFDGEVVIARDLTVVEA